MADETSEPEDTEELPGEGTPEGEKLRAAHAAFDAGDYASVRTLTGELVDVSDREVAQSAHDLRRRVSVDPVQVAVLLACFLFFAWISWKYVFSS